MAAKPSRALTELQFKRIGNLPDEYVFVRRVQTWDTAAKDGPRCDYSVGMTFGWHADEERWYLLEIYRKRTNITELEAAIGRLRKQWYADKVLIEDSAMGTSILQEFWKETAASSRGSTL